LVPNVGILLYFGAAIFVVWVFAAVKDWYVKTRYPTRSIFLLHRHEPWVFNFGVRFFYEIYLELCICTFVNLAFM